MVLVKLTKDVYWVGVVDWAIRDFHSFEIRKGTTYNAYFIDDDKKALVDTVKYPFKSILAYNIREIAELESLEYVIINHIEMDHSSSLSYIMQFAKNATIVTSKRGKDGVTKYYGEHDWNFQIVKTGDEIHLGRRTLSFIEAPMLHWPDSMFTYLKEDEILMSNDAFGQHLASSQRFDDEVEESVLLEESARYYANILMPFASLIRRKINEIINLGVKPKIIAPSHGVIWRSDPEKIINSYLEWSEGKTKEKVVIVYDTMWNSTQKMAYVIFEAMAEEGIDTHLYQLRRSDSAQILKEILDSSAVIVGSPTLNNSMFPTVSAFINYVSGLKPKNKLWASFGSYGWSGGAVRNINKLLHEVKFEVLEPSLQIKFSPTNEELQECRKFGKTIAQKIKVKN